MAITRMAVINHNNTEGSKESEAAHWGLWGTLLWGAVLAIVFIVLQTVTITGILIAQDRHLGAVEFQHAFVAATTNGQVLSLVTFVTTIVCTGLLAGIIKLKKGTVLKEYLSIRSAPFSTLLQWLGVLVVFIASANVITLTLGRPLVTDFMSEIYASAEPMWMLWVALIIAAPLFEETFFRGFLLRGLAASFMGPIGAVLVTAVLWALIHTQYDAYDRTIIFCLGLLLGAARVRTGSLLVPLGLHAAMNLEATIETALFG